MTYKEGDKCRYLMSVCLFLAFSYWLFGLMVMALMVLMSALSSSMGIVIFGVGLCYFAMTILGLFPRIEKYLPTYLTSSQTILSGNDKR